MSSPANEAAMSGQAWDRFCDTLKRAGRQILRDEAAAAELDRAEGWRYLTRLLRLGLEMHLEFADPEFPGFFAPSHETAKIGADNPDNLYLMARIDGRHAYRIHGRRGTAPYLSFGTQKGGYEIDGRMEQTGFLDGRELEYDADGRFLVHVSREPPPEGSWLRLEPQTNAVIVRQTFQDRARESAATLQIERAAGDITLRPRPLDPDTLVRGLARAAGFVEGTATLFADWAQSYLKHVNSLPAADQQVCQRAGGDPNIRYHHSAWAVEPDQMLVIRLPRIPQCRYWNLQINNWWMESLDYRHYRIHHNAHSAQRDDDDGVTLVLAHRDPGHPNWLETAGHTRGTMCLRWVGASEHVDPVTELRPFERFSVQ